MIRGFKPLKQSASVRAGISIKLELSNNFINFKSNKIMPCFNSLLELTFFLYSPDDHLKTKSELRASPSIDITPHAKAEDSSVNSLKNQTIKIPLTGLLSNIPHNISAPSIQLQRTTDAVNILKTFISKATDVKTNTKSNNRITTEAGANVHRLSNTTNSLPNDNKLFDIGNFGNSDVTITVTSPVDGNMQNNTEHNPGNKTDNTSLLHPSVNRRDVSLNNFDNMSFDDFGGTLFKNQHDDILKNNNHHLFGEFASSTPSLPSAMHRPLTVDFSDASLSNINLFQK